MLGRQPRECRLRCTAMLARDGRHAHLWCLSLNSRDDLAFCRRLSKSTDSTVDAPARFQPPSIRHDKRGRASPRRAPLVMSQISALFADFKEGLVTSPRAGFSLAQGFATPDFRQGLDGVALSAMMISAAPLRLLERLTELLPPSHRANTTFRVSPATVEATARLFTRDRAL